jgi:hypothetical protein
MEDSNPLLHSFKELIKAFGLPEAKTSEKNESHEKIDDPMEALKVTLEKFKQSLNEVNSIKNDIATKSGTNPDARIDEENSNIPEKNKKALRLFAKELKNWENDLVQLMKDNPEIAMAIDSADLSKVGKVDKSKIRKKRKANKKNKWLSA